MMIKAVTDLICNNASFHMAWCYLTLSILGNFSADDILKWWSYFFFFFFFSRKQVFIFHANCLYWHEMSNHVF